MLGWVWDNAFTLGYPRTGASCTWLSFWEELCTAHIPSYMICCLEHPVLVQMYSRQMIRLEWQWRKTSDSSLVDRRCKCRSLRPAQAEHGPSPGWSANGPIMHFPCPQPLLYSTSYTSFPPLVQLTSSISHFQECKPEHQIITHATQHTRTKSLHQTKKPYLMGSLVVMRYQASLIFCHTDSAPRARFNVIWIGRSPSCSLQPGTCRACTVTPHTRVTAVTTRTIVTAQS